MKLIEIIGGQHAGLGVLLGRAEHKAKVPGAGGLHFQNKGKHHLHQ